MFDKMKPSLVLLCSVFASLAFQAHCSAAIEGESGQHGVGDKSAALDVMEYLPEGFKSGFADVLAEDNSRHTKTDADMAETWFAEKARSYKGRSIELKLAFGVLSRQDTKCSPDLMMFVLDFMKRIKRQYPDKAHYARYIGRKKIEFCASQFTEEFNASPKSKLEWTMDSFFRLVSASQQHDQSLLTQAREFNLGRMPNPSKTCKVARAFNKLRLSYPAYWRDERAARKLDHYLSRTYTIDCEKEVPQFFQAICALSRDDGSKQFEIGLQYLNLARALGAELGQIANVRTQKFNEYKRICQSFPEFRETIEVEMKKESRDLVEPEEPSQDSDGSLDDSSDSLREALEPSSWLVNNLEREKNGWRFWKN